MQNQAHGVAQDDSYIHFDDDDDDDDDDNNNYGNKVQNNQINNNKHPLEEEQKQSVDINRIMLSSNHYTVGGGGGGGGGDENISLGDTNFDKRPQIGSFNASGRVVQQQHVFALPENGSHARQALVSPSSLSLSSSQLLSPSSHQHVQLQSQHANQHQHRSLSLNSNRQGANLATEEHWRSNSLVAAQNLGIKTYQIPVYKMLREQMTLDSDVALFLIIAHDVQNEQGAFEILASDENDFFQHYFLPFNGDGEGAARASLRGTSHNKGTGCRICARPLAEHTLQTAQDREYASGVYKRVQSALAGNNVLDLQVLAPVDVKECQICLERVDARTFLHINDTCHEVCVACFKLYLQDRIYSNNRVNVITCPHCPLVLTQNVIQQYVDQKTYNKYVAFLRDYLIRQDPLNRWCPNVHCSKIVRLPALNAASARCTHCNTVICGKCGLEEHGAVPCDKVTEELLRNLTDAQDIQRCQQCKALVQKLSGCNHMTCSVCEYQWCWLCGATFDPVHFAPFNPFGCPAMQNGSFNVQNSGPVRRCLMRLLAMIGIIFVIPLALVLGLPVYLSFISHEIFRSACGQVQAVMLSVLVFFAAFILDPIVWFLFVIGVVPFLIFIVCQSMRQRAQVQESSLRNLLNRNNRNNLQAVVVQGR